MIRFLESLTVPSGLLAGQAFTVVRSQRRLDAAGRGRAPAPFHTSAPAMVDSTFENRPQGDVYSTLCTPIQSGHPVIMRAARHNF